MLRLKKKIGENQERGNIAAKYPTSSLKISEEFGELEKHIHLKEIQSVLKETPRTRQIMRIRKTRTDENERDVEISEA